MESEIQITSSTASKTTSLSTSKYKLTSN